MAPIRIEAEDMILTNYLVESGNSAASGGNLISLFKAGSPTGTASSIFSGSTGTYDLVIGYFDENDGNATVSVSVGGNQYLSNLNQNKGSASAIAQTFVQRTLATGITVTEGEAIALTGTMDQAEWARVDYIEFIPTAIPSAAASPTFSTSNASSPGSLAFSASSFSVNEDGTSVAAVTITRTDGSAGAVSVQLNLSNGTATNADYDNAPMMVSFASGDSTPKTINIPIANDVLVENSETINLSLSNATSGATIGTQNTAILTIVDNDGVINPPPVTPGAPIRIEAEDMTLTNYKIESVPSVASNGKLISLFQTGSVTGSASYNFDGAAGIYELKVAYHDEVDGQAQLTVNVAGNQVALWNLTKYLGNAGVGNENRVIRSAATGLTLNPGDLITLNGTVNQTEYARIDYIELIPVATIINGTEGDDTLTGDELNNIINGFGGNDSIDGGDGNDIIDGGAGNNTIDGGNGIDTVSYASSTTGVIADLGTGEVTRKFGTSSTTPLKIMPLGDSNTRGKEPGVNEPNRAGYRDDLWTYFKDDGFNIDFVGSAVPEGPNTVAGVNGTYTFDKNHQGIGGYAIKGPGALGELLPNLDGWLNASQPDVVLLMAGTNDFIFQNTTAEATIAELEELIDKIFTFSPTINLFVSSIAPISPNQSYAQEAADYNDLIPGLLAQNKYIDKNLTLVDTRDSLSVNDLWDGIHLTNAGYTIQANEWYDAILNKGNGKDTLSNIENITGSVYNDELTGSAGVNVINGSGGNDLLTGDAASDTFVLAVGEGTDTITDFVVGEDLLGLSGGLAFGQLMITQAITDTLISITSSGEHLALLAGVEASTITINDFTTVA